MKQLFKFCRSPFRILEEGYIRATQLAGLNDPFEAVYCRDGLQELTKHFDDLEPDQVVKHVEENINKVGVICLSEAKDNLLMWSHYADEYRGALVGITVNHPDIDHFENLLRFTINSTNVLGDSKYDIFTGRCVPVQYRKQPRYRVDRFDFDYSNVSVEGADRLLYEVFQQKSDEWIYEKEHRITLRLEQADLVIVEDLDSISNKTLLSNLRGCAYCDEWTESGKTKHRFRFAEMKDDGLREIYASAVSDLASNQNNLYFFKLSSSALTSVTLGHRGTDGLISPLPDFPTATGFFDSYEADLNMDSYTISINPFVHA